MMNVLTKYNLEYIFTSLSVSLLFFISFNVGNNQGKSLSYLYIPVVYSYFYFFSQCFNNFIAVKLYQYIVCCSLYLKVTTVV